MSDISKRLDLLQKEIYSIKEDIAIMKNSGNLFTDTAVFRPTLRQITRCVCAATGVPYAKIHSKRQDRQVVVPRQIISCIARWEYYYSFSAIGRYFNQGHDNIIYSTKTMKGLISTDAKMAELYKKCIKCVKNLNK